MVSQEGFKEMGGAKPLARLVPQAPFGRPPAGFGPHDSQEYQPGELVMLSNGLYRVKAAESMSFNLHMGMAATTITGTEATSLLVQLDETHADLATKGFQLPAGTKIILGTPDAFNENTQIVTLAQRGEIGRASGQITISGAATNNKTVTIVSTDGTSKAYVKKSAEDLTTDPCQFHGSSVQLTMESLVRCIADAEGGHNGKIITEHFMSGSNGIIRLIQAAPGIAGSTTGSVSDNDANISCVDFGSAAGYSDGTLAVANLKTVETIETRFNGAGTEATILYIPGISEDSDGAIEKLEPLLNKRSFSFLESPDSRKIVYDLTWGVSMHPKYIGQDGGMTGVGIGSFDGSNYGTYPALDGSAGGSTDLIDIGNAVSGMMDGAGATTDATADTYDMFGIGRGPTHGRGYGYGYGVAYHSMISPKIRVFQPRGQIRFTTDQNSGRSETGGDSDGFVDAGNSSMINPNPSYRLITGSGTNGNLLPNFQLVNDTSENLRDPRILITGFKYLFEEVSDGEVREMIRRSGRFNYKIVQNAGQMSAASDGVTGPTEGWKALVENQRGRKMSFEEYKRATEKITDQSMNMLYGTSSSDRLSGSSDPRRRHRSV